MLVDIILGSSAKVSRLEARLQKSGTRRLRHSFREKNGSPGSAQSPKQMLRLISNPHPFSPSNPMIRLRRFLLLLLVFGITAVTIEQFVHSCRPDFVSTRAPPLGKLIVTTGIVGNLAMFPPDCAVNWFA